MDLFCEVKFCHHNIFFSCLSQTYKSSDTSKCFCDCRTGRNATLLVSVTGGDSVTVTDMLLVEASGSGVVNGTIKAVGATDFLVNVDRIPEGAFVVQLKGLLNDTSMTNRF